MNLDETDYQLLVSAMQQNCSEAEDIFTSTSGWLRVCQDSDLLSLEPKITYQNSINVVLL